MTDNRTHTTNLAAEFYVASQLCRLGYIVTLTLGHTKEIDLLVAHPDGRKVSIDVKGLKNKTNWPVKAKLISRTHFFVLVSYLDRFDEVSVQPEVFVVPSTRMTPLLGSWTGRPEVSALAYRDIRNTRFKNAWHLLFRQRNGA